MQHTRKETHIQQLRGLLGQWCGLIHIIEGHGDWVGHDRGQGKGQQLVHLSRCVGQQGAQLRPGAVGKAAGRVDNHKPASSSARRSSRDCEGQHSKRLQAARGTSTSCCHVAVRDGMWLVYTLCMPPHALPP